jgi:hypothetical protein
MLATITVVGVAFLAVLIWVFLQTRSKDQLDLMMQKRRESCRLVSRADYVDAMQKLHVALCLSDDALYYENADLQASFELSRLDEIEYDDELATGRAIPAGTRALRLRSHGTVFEFVLPMSEIAKWQAALPPRRSGAPVAKAG